MAMIFLVEKITVNIFFVIFFCNFSFFYFFYINSLLFLFFFSNPSCLHFSCQNKFFISIMKIFKNNGKYFFFVIFFCNFQFLLFFLYKFTFILFFFRNPSRLHFSC